jgi:hypothetical protein
MYKAANSWFAKINDGARMSPLALPRVMAALVHPDALV